MLRNGLRHCAPSPASAAAWRATGDSEPEFSEYLASGPAR